VTTPLRAWEVFSAFLLLGLTAFGGPIAHLGYFQNAFVLRRGWLDEAAYARIVALCQMLPGPTSSQVGLILGARRAGIAGGLAAWVGFTLPSAALMTAFAFGLARIAPERLAPWLHGLLIAAVAVVALAVLRMAASLCPNAPCRVMAAVAAGVMLYAPQSGVLQLGLIALGALCGQLACRHDDEVFVAASPGTGSTLRERRPRSTCRLVLFEVRLVPFRALIGTKATWDDMA
jgi:chromate transporter